VDSFCEMYFRQVGLEGMTNYFHLLFAGHYSYFLLKYGNLYRFSQQGWENVNSVLKRSFHSNTQKGGGKGGSSKLLPVFFRLCRGMLWRYRLLDKLFVHLGYEEKLEFEYGKIQSTPRSDKVKIEEVIEFSNTLFSFLDDDDYDEFLEVIDEDIFFTEGTDIQSDIMADNN
jgi:hypothetical protein